MSSKCNVYIMIYALDKIVLQKNIDNDVTQWTSSGGCFSSEMKPLQGCFSSEMKPLRGCFSSEMKPLRGCFSSEMKPDFTSALEKKFIDILEHQFKDPTMVTFAYFAVRNLIKDLFESKKDFVYNSLINNKASLVYINHVYYGFPDPGLSQTEHFYIEFEEQEVFDHLVASGEKNCKDFIILEADFLLEADVKSDKVSETDNIRIDTLAMTAHIHKIRKRIKEARSLNSTQGGEQPRGDFFHKVLHMPLKPYDILFQTDLGSGFYRLFSIKDHKYVILGKRFNGQLKLGIGGAVKKIDKSLYETIIRKSSEKQFGLLPITTDIMTDYYIKFNPKSNKKGTNGGVLYFSFYYIEQQYTLEDIESAVYKMNQIALIYSRLNQFLTDIKDKIVQDNTSIEWKTEQVPSIRPDHHIEWTWESVPYPKQNWKTEHIASIINTAKEFLRLSTQANYSKVLVDKLTEIANGKCTMTSRMLDDFTEANVRIHSEFSYFTIVPFEVYHKALINNETIECTPTGDSSNECTMPGSYWGVTEKLSLFKPERESVLTFLSTKPCI